MMLNPTLNRSFRVSSNSGTIIFEKDRMKMSTIIFQYGIDSSSATLLNTESMGLNK